MIYYLKTHPEEFKAVASGYKTFELRKNDRGYKKDDILCLQQFHPEKGYGGSHCFVNIDYILEGGKFGLLSGYVAMSVSRLKNEDCDIDRLHPVGSKLS